MLKNLQARGTVSYVKNCHHLGVLELLLLTSGRNLIFLLNVGYVVVLLVLLGNHLMVNGSMLSVLRLNLFFALNKH